MKLRRYEGNPILKPKPENEWESEDVFNPAVVYDTYTAYSERGVRIGAGAPPIKTEKGWLLIYHGVDEDGVYRLGAALLSLDDPSKLLYRHPEHILEPEADYEIRGEVPRVVFACGACEVRNKYFVYYGGADSVVCVATVDKEEMLGIF
jgi:predicted GH43/DUF377 family glycosyl hydrolase